jgi:hypothetical protein
MAKIRKIPTLKIRPIIQSLTDNPATMRRRIIKLISTADLYTLAGTLLLLEASEKQKRICDLYRGLAQDKDKSSGERQNDYE